MSVADRISQIVRPLAIPGLLALAFALLFIAAPLYVPVGQVGTLLSLCLGSNPPTTGEALWRSWSFAPQAVIPLLLAMALYAYGVRVARKSPQQSVLPAWRVACFAAGWTVLIVALVSPLCRLAATLVWAHMVQHVLLVAVAPPLLVLGAPHAAMRAVSRGLAWTRPRWLGGSFVATLLYGVAIWLWHAPALYEKILLQPVLHAFAYLALVAVSLLYWSSILSQSSSHHRTAGVFALFTTLIHTGLLGALLTFAATPWYPVQAAGAAAWGLSPLEDQQLAGLIMWVPMGAIYLVAALACTAALLGVPEKNLARS